MPIGNVSRYNPIVSQYVKQVAKPKAYVNIPAPAPPKFAPKLEISPNKPAGNAPNIIAAQSAGFKYRAPTETVNEYRKSVLAAVAPAAVASAAPQRPAAEESSQDYSQDYSDPGFQEQGQAPQAQEDSGESEDRAQTEDFREEQEGRREEESAEEYEEYEEEESPAQEDEATFYGEDIPVSSYMHNGYLTCTTVRYTPWGILPNSITAKMKNSQLPNGPVNFGADPMADRAITEAKRRLVGSTLDEQQRLAAESLVLRARCGDQNAMAIISLVAQNSKKSPRAYTAYQHIQKYIDMHPVSDSPFGVDAPQSVGTNEPSLNRAAVHFANNGPLNKARINDMLDTFVPSNQKRKVVTFGIVSFALDEAEWDKYKDQLDKLGKALLDLGRAMGFGRAIQIVRSNGPISAVSKKASWELGE